MKLTMFFTIICGVLTICGAIYVLSSGGKVSAGYAVIPMVFSLIFSNSTLLISKYKRKQK